MPTSIKGLQEAQRAMFKLIAAVKPSGAMANAVRMATIDAIRYAISITHVDTGTLRASHRMRMETDSREARGVIYIDPNAIRPGGGRPARYGVGENFRGGSHAFYARVPVERGESIARQAANAIIRSIS